MRLIGYTAIIFAVLTCSLQAQTVVVNTNLALSANNQFPPANYRFDVWQDAAHTDVTSVWFKYDGFSIDIIQYNIDEGSDWYVVNNNNKFTRDAVNAGQFPVLLEAKFPPPPDPPAYNLSGFNFWLGVATHQGAAFRPRTVFGWVHLHPAEFGSNVLTMLDNAMSYNSPGIIVGTTTIVPEPATIALTACGLVPVVFTRRTRRK